MLFELFALAILIVFGIVYLGTFKGKSSLPLLIAAGCVALIAGMYLGSEGLTSGSVVPILVNTTEDSRYWNCTILNVSCEGEVTPYPATNACWEYTYTQCISIPGCNWTYSGQSYYCNGTPSVTCNWLGSYDPTGEKCFETKGCAWHRNETNGTCDWVFTDYQYSTNVTGNATGGLENRNDNFTLMMSLMVIMFGLYLIVGPIAARFLGKRNDDDEFESEEGDEDE